MLDVINLALPFFGLIFLGFAFGKLKSIPDEGLAWMNFLWVEQASSAVLTGTLASVLTLTTVMWLVKTQQLPVLIFR
jgi:hypothetical protein